MINHWKFFRASLAIAMALAIACGSPGERGPGAAQNREQSPIVAGQTKVTQGPTGSSLATGESPVPPSDLPGVGTGVGDLSPGYGLLLADGSTVTSGDLARAGKPVFLMFTATW